ncbi:MAG: lytic transglycosylase domain-containing protein [Desulfobacterales bacterium]
MRNLRCQIGQKDPFRQGIIRSGAYLTEMKQIFHDAGLPEDLVYLPHVESSFNPEAYSKFGAAGMWQFTRSTGKSFMTVSYAVDERRDPIISTRAAARLLKRNYKKLRNWPMAITAYNHGVTGMLRAKRRKGDYETIFKEYRSRIFKFASRNFYSEFLPHF